MAETKKTEAAAAAAPPEAACLTLRQKLVEMRKACPEIVKKQHSDGVSYKYAKIYDVWEKITPIRSGRGSARSAPGGRRAQRRRPRVHRQRLE